MTKRLELTMEQKVKVVHAELLTRMSSYRPLKRKNPARDLRWLRWIADKYLGEVVK
ncbi:MAG: hypothetical protein R3F02_05615 [Thiolinea sp.]